MQERTRVGRAGPQTAPVRWPGRRYLAGGFGVLIAVLLAVPLFGLAAVKGLIPTRVINGVAGLFIHRQKGAVAWQPDQSTGVAGAAEQPVNILVMGVEIEGAATNPLTDAMMVVSYDPKQESLSMLSIPRDLWVDIPGHGLGRINEAFEDGAAAEAVLTVQQHLGIPVNYYAVLTYDPFEKLIDDMGGVTVDVPRNIDDPTFPADDMIHFEPFHITKGIHHLGGHETLRYARERHSDPDGDEGRVRRQQQVLLALKSQFLRPGNLSKLGLIVQDIRATVRTNFPLDQAVGLALKIMRIDNSRIQKGTLGYADKAVADYTTHGGAEVLLGNPPVIKQIVSRMFAPALSYLQAGASVRVDNGNGYPLAATNYGKILAGMGVQVVPPGDADRKDYPTARVRVYTHDPAKVAEATLLAGMLGVQPEPATGQETVEVVITLGKDYAPYVKFNEADWDAAIKPQ